MTTIPSPQRGPAPNVLAPVSSGLERARRALEVQTVTALAFDLLIFGAMARLGWQLLTPWEHALDAADGLWLLGLLVCGGLWAASIDRDISRWRRLRRRATPR